MKKAIVFLTDGFEEMECVVPVDILRRAGVDVELLSITGSLEVTGARGIKVLADGQLTNGIDAEMLILPGGKGAEAYIHSPALVDALKKHNDKGGYIAAICAAPVTLGKLGMLKDKNATCYPGMEGELNAKAHKTEAVVIDGNIITARGPGASAQFGLALVEILTGQDAAQRVKTAMLL